MALLLIEGFDHVTAETSLSTKSWYFSSANWTITAGGGRFGGNCLYDSTYNYYSHWQVPGTPPATIYFGGAFKKTAGATSYWGTYPFIAFKNDTGIQNVCFYWLTDYTLQAQRTAGGTVLGTSSLLLPDNSWFYMEMKITIHDTAGEVLVYVDGVEYLNLTSQDTLASGNANIKDILLRAMYAKGMSFDDLYLDSSQFHGDSVVKTFLPDANGTYTDFTPSTGSNYQNVDDANPDGDTTHNEGTDEGDKDSYGITTSGINGPIKGVQVSNYERRTGSLTVKTKPLVRTGGSDYLGDEAALGVDYGFNIKLWENNPDTTNPWTSGELDAAEFGTEITAMSTTTTT